MNIKKILKNISLIPKKQLGQNFLNNNEIAQKIVDSFNLQTTDNVLEVGSGLGALTQFLFRTQKVVAIEKSVKLFSFLQMHFGHFANVSFYNQDVFDFDFQVLQAKTKYKVIGNLPYSLAIKILKLFLLKKQFFSHLYFSFSKEVADKILANSNDKKSSSLSIFVNFFSHLQESLILPSSVFYPQPKVQSAFIMFELRQKNLFSNTTKTKKFLNFIEYCFFYKRKTMINNLRQRYNLVKEQLVLLGLFLNKEHGSDQVRAEALGLNDFIVFFNTFSGILIEKDEK